MWRGAETFDTEIWRWFDSEMFFSYFIFSYSCVYVSVFPAIVAAATAAAAAADKMPASILNYEYHKQTMRLYIYICLCLLCTRRSMVISMHIYFMCVVAR